MVVLDEYLLVRVVIGEWPHAMPTTRIFSFLSVDTGAFFKRCMVLEEGSFHRYLQN